MLSYTCTTPPPADDLDLSPVRTPAEELSTFQLEPGLSITLVASEPMVQDPVAITFDEDGRLWVVEMKGYMPTIEGNAENEPSGRISILEDTDGDGLMDRSTIYLDSLIMPRSIGLIKNGALVAHNNSLWLTHDLDGDLRADTQTLLDSTYSSNGLVEHSDNGLLRNPDNWYYSVKSRLRYRQAGGRWIRDSTEFRGQWGMSHDDEGRLYYNYNWSQLHADLVPPNYLSRNKNHKPSTGIDHGLTIDRRVYPVRSTPAVNRGYIPGTLDEEEKLIEFTAACSPTVLRSTAFPAEYYGNVFVCEPAGNLVKRNVVSESGVLLSAADPRPGTEFLASTDERFRPVNAAVGPDGALYIVDMYHGIIQDGKYATPYLKEKTLERQLDQPIHLGRIWRIAPENHQAARSEKLSALSTAQLVERLSHADGWHRDMAQRLLVERADAAAVPLLEQLIKTSDNHLARFHALWTLEGLGDPDTDLLLALLTDASPLLQSSALRILEPIARTNGALRGRMENTALKSYEDASIEQVLQLALSADAMNPTPGRELLARIITDHAGSPLIRDAVLSSLENRELEFLKTLWTASGWQQQEQPKEIFLEMLTTAIVNKKDPAELGSLLAMLSGSQGAAGWKEKTVVTGLTIQASNVSKAGAVKLAKAPQLLSSTDTWLDASKRAALSSMFEWPGHKASQASASEGSVLDEQGKELFALGRQGYLTTCAGCHGTDGAGISRFAPPLAGSEWVTGDEKRLALIILHGIEGSIEVAGKKYDAPDILPVMPAHSTMDDGNIAAILTYIRNEWGNNAGAITRRLVGGTRVTSQGRVVPWTPAELNAHIEKLNAEEAKKPAQ